MFKIGRDHWRSLWPISLFKEGSIEYIIQNCVQMAFEYPVVGETPKSLSLTWIRNMTNINILNYIFTQKSGEWDNGRKQLNHSFASSSIEKRWTSKYICIFFFFKNVGKITDLHVSDQIKETGYKIWEDKNILSLYWLKQCFCVFF